MQSHYRITVSQHDHWLFDTADRITDSEHAQRLLTLFKERFPTAEGFGIELTRWELSGYSVYRELPQAKPKL